MTETAMRELDEAAPAAFVNGDATQQHPPGGGPRRVAKAAARRERLRNHADVRPAAERSPPAWPASVGVALRLHEAWRDGLADLAREQLALVAETGSSIAETGRALMAEPEPARRMELVWAQGLLQLERSLEASTRLVDIMASTGQDLLDASGTGRHHPG